MAEKRYFWLKLHSDFFSSKRIKKLRRLAGGDTFTIIYLKLQLQAIKTDGILEWIGLEDSFAKELAMDIDEDAENVEIVLRYLLSCGLAEEKENNKLLLPFAVKNTGKEGSSASRMRELRKRETERKLTERNETAQESSQSDNNVTDALSHRYGEIEIEKEIEIEIDKKHSACFQKPTIAEIRSYCLERGKGVDAEAFYDHYESNGWKVGKASMKDWKAAVRTWERTGYNKPQKPKFDFTERETDYDAILRGIQ